MRMVAAASLVAVVILGTPAVVPVPGLAQTPAPAPPPTPATTPVATPAPSASVVRPGSASAAAGIAGRVITVDEAIEVALQTQPQILARLFDYAAARFRVDQAFAPLLPQLSGTVSTSRSSSTSFTSSSTGGGNVPITITRDFNESFAARVSLSQLLFDFGKNFASVEVSRKLAEVAQEDIELQRQLITLAVKEAYTNILFAQRLIRVQRQALERAELNLRSARGFFEVGTRPKSDVSRAEVDVANARLDNIRATNSERLARVALNTAMGIPATTPTQVVDNLVYAPVTLDPDQLLAESLRQRPELRQAKLRVEGSEATIKRTFRDFFPDINLGGSYGGVRTELNEAWEVSLSLTWNIFDGGNKFARLREAKANYEGSVARLRSTELDIAQNVEQAQLTVTEADERILAAQTAVASAQENFRLAQGRFDAGVGTILELTDAQLALTQAQNTEAQALADFRIALARLDRAVGRR